MATKKTKKFETPIDQRETFVSIQKTFADSDLSVEEKLKTLYELQNADTEIDKILQLRGELPLEVEHLQNEIAAINSKTDKLKEEAAGLQDAIAEYKNNIEECNSLIAKYSAQVDNVANSREYDSLNKEIENQDLLRQIAEKKIWEAKDRISEINAILRDLAQKLNIRQADLDAKEAELSTIVKDTAAEEERLRAIREQCAEKIDARTMSAYERIRNSCNNHLAVVSVYNGNACGGCMNTIPPQRLIEIAANKKMNICEYCGRILVNPEFEI